MTVGQRVVIRCAKLLERAFTLLKENRAGFTVANVMFRAWVLRRAQSAAGLD